MSGNRRLLMQETMSELERQIRSNAPVNLKAQSDLIITGAYNYTTPIYAKNLTIKADAVISITPMTPLVIWAETITIEEGANINLDGKGWCGGKINATQAHIDKANEMFSLWLNYMQIENDTGIWANGWRPALGYVPSQWLRAVNADGGTNHRYTRRGGVMPDVSRPGVQRYMLGLSEATSPEATDWGPGANGTNGGGGGGGGDGFGGGGGGSGAGGGGGSASNGAYMSPKGGNGSQANIATNLQLLKDWALDQIPILGGGGGHGYNTADGGDGGGAIQLFAAKTIAIGQGVNISCKGTNGVGYAYYNRGGGGGGGSIIIVTPELANNGTLSVTGGLGAPGIYPGGNGGEGLILINTEVM